MHYLLKDVFNVAEGAELTFTNTLPLKDGQEVGLDWALGAAVVILVDTARRVAQQQMLWWGLVALAAAVSLMVMVYAASLIAVVAAACGLTSVRSHQMLAGVVAYASWGAFSSVNARMVAVE
jgi:hypothetical protein